MSTAEHLFGTLMGESPRCANSRGRGRNLDERFDMAERTCAHPEGCDRPVEARRLCGKHYQRVRYNNQLADWPLDPAPDPVCSIEGCDRKHYARTWCSLHYRRWQDYGDPEVHGSTIVMDHVRRFESYVDRNGPLGCWIWTGTIGTEGYGQFRVVQEKHLAHRWSYEHHVGPIPEGLHLDHLCRVTSCVNPQHLEPVTMKENILRGVSPSAINARKTHCKRGHEFTETNTWVGMDGSRHCRQCRRDLRAAERAKRRVNPGGQYRNVITQGDGK